MVKIQNFLTCHLIVKSLVYIELHLNINLLNVFCLALIVSDVLSNVSKKEKS